MCEGIWCFPSFSIYYYCQKTQHENRTLSSSMTSKYFFFRKNVICKILLKRLQSSEFLIISMESIQNEEKRQNEALQAYHKQLFKDGVNFQDYIIKRQCFKLCGYCMETFDSLTLMPALLQCGHVICQLCLSVCPACVFCNSKILVKIQKYTRLLERPVSANPDYDFSIKISQTRRIIITRQKGTATVGSLFSKFENLVKFCKESSRPVIYIKSRRFLYHQIKDKRISEFQRYLEDSSTGEFNILTVINDRFGFY